MLSTAGLATLVRARRRVARRRLRGAPQYDVRRHVPRREGPHPAGRRHSARSRPKKRSANSSTRCSNSATNGDGRHRDLASRIPRRFATPRNSGSSPIAGDRSRSIRRRITIRSGAAASNWRRADVPHLAHRRAAPAFASNYVFNHLGMFAGGSEHFCRALFFGGVDEAVSRVNSPSACSKAAWRGP